MIILLTAQTMGWCRAYVCDCSGTTEITTANHCHGVDVHHFGHGLIDHDHDDHDDVPPCDDHDSELSSHHDHELMAGSFCATGPRNDEAAHLMDVPLAVIAIISIPTPEWNSVGGEKQPEPRGRASCHALGPQMRLTVALLV